MKFSQFIENNKLSFHSPITQEEWDRITDVELERTEEITFKTPNGKEIPFRKIKHGKWISHTKFDKILNREIWWAECSVCGEKQDYALPKYCMHCGADMRGETK